MFQPQVSRRGKHYFAEIALTRGPRVMAATGTGSYQELFGYVWMALLDRSEQSIRLFQARDAGAPWAIGGPAGRLEWAEVVVPDLPHPTRELRHLGLAFDQSARHVVAYERAGEVWVRQWDPARGQYVMRGPWPGTDPVVINDATVNWRIPDSDVLVFHLNASRTSVVMRTQRELYQTEHVIYTSAEGMYLDQGIDLPLRFEVVGSTESDPSKANVVLQSELYPLHLPQEQLGAIGLHGIPSATYKPVVVVYGLTDESLGTAAVAMQPSAAYVPMVIEQSLGLDGIGAVTAAQPSAHYKTVVISIDLVAPPYSLDQSSATIDALGSGIYKLVVIVHDLTGAGYALDGVGAASLSAQGGASYVAA